MKEFTCIICPRGCRLVVDDKQNVSGNFCVRGKEYALTEITHPMRTLTSSVRVINRKYTLVSVKTNAPIPKELIFKAMELINKTFVTAPINIGDVVISNLLNTGVDVVITKNLK